MNATVESNFTAFKVLEGFTGCFFFVDFMVHLVILVALVALRNRQPVRSRYITPFLLQAAFIVYSFTNSYSHFTYFFAAVGVIQPWKTALDITASSLFDVSYILTSSANGAYVMHTIRYFVLINRQALQKTKKGSTLYFRLLRILISNWLYWVCVLFPFVVVTAISAITVGLRYGAGIPHLDSDVVFWLYVIWNVAAAITTFAVACVDIVINIVQSRADKSKSRKFTTRLYDFFVRSDPFLFRLEMMAVGGCIFFVLIAIVAGAFSPVGEETKGQIPFPTRPLQDQRDMLVTGYIALFGYVMYYVLEQFRSGGIVVLRAIRLLWLEKNRKSSGELSSNAYTESTADELKDVINDKDDGYKIFEEYCKSEYSVENLLAFVSIERYKTLAGIERLREARHLLDNYIAVGSPFEVNIVNKERTKVQVAVTQAEAASSSATAQVQTPTGEPMAADSLTDDLLDDIQKALKFNLSDTFSRFVVASQYTAYRKRKNEVEQEHELLTKANILAKRKTMANLTPIQAQDKENSVK